MVSRQGKYERRKKSAASRKKEGELLAIYGDKSAAKFKILRIISDFTSVIYEFINPRYSNFLNLFI